MILFMWHATQLGDKTKVSMTIKDDSGYEGSLCQIEILYGI